MKGIGSQEAGAKGDKIKYMQKGQPHVLSIFRRTHLSYKPSVQMCIK